MSRPNRWALGVFLLCGLGAFDSPRIHGQTVPGPIPPARRDEAWARFNGAHGGRWRVDWNRVTGTPHRISGGALAIAEPVTARNVEAVSRRVIAEERALLQADPASLVLHKATLDRPPGTPGERGNWHVSFRQVHRGVPVEGGNVRLLIRGQRVTLLGSDVFPGVDLAVRPSVTKEQAERTVQSDLGQRSFEAVSADLSILPRPTKDRIVYHLVWSIVTPVVHVPARIAFPDESFGQTRDAKKRAKEERLPARWRYRVDARSGAILERENTMTYENLTGNVTGLVHPALPADAPVTVPIAGMRVTVTQGAITATGETDAAGNYTIGGLGPGPASLEAHLAGTHVRSHNNETPDPDATHSSIVTVPGTHDWDWDAGDPSPADVQTHAFSHLNSNRDWFLRGNPFTISPLPDPMEIYVRDGPYCNASADSAGLYFGSGDASCQDFALCADIVYHEYNHRIVAKVYDDAGVSLPYSGQTGAMNEAWSDYFAASRLGNPHHGGGCYSGRHLDTPDRRFPDDWAGGVHRDGVIFSGALWDLRDVLGATYVDSLALRAMKQATTSFSDYLSAVLEEDDDPLYSPSPLANNNLADGTPNIDAICHAYYDGHGIYDAHCLGHTQRPVAVITSPSPIEFNLLDGSSPTVTITGSALGSATSAFTSFTLEWAAEGAPSTWSTTGITLSGGGAVPVNAVALGTLDITGLADGFYIVRLTVTAGGTTATARTHLVLDRLLMSGWPQLTSVRFYGSPAVADLAPAAAGREIVAHGTDGNLYVWHRDGTLAAGWPRYAGWSDSAPAVADLDGDGSLEVVVVTWGSVRAFRADGTAVAGWPRSCGPEMDTTPAIADLDGDGDLEIVVGSPSSQVCAWHHDGAAVAGWPAATTGAVRSSPALGDLDDDGLPEVVVGANDGKVCVLRGTGAALAGWPQTVTAAVSASPALGDIDGDGDLEVVAGTEDSKVNAWHHTGVALAGWPQTMTQFVMDPASVTLGDLDSDGALEVVVMSNDDRIHAWRGDGTPLPGWPPAGTGFGGYEFVVASPAMGDIDGDGDQEVVAEASFDTVDGAHLFKVFAFHHDGSAVSGWPRIVGSYSNSSPALADVNVDGSVDVVMGSRGIYVWDLPGAYSEQAMEWPFYRHDIRRTGAFGPKAGVVLLFDTSGSMSWRHDGTMGAPLAEQRITKAQQAATPFLEMLNDFNSGKAGFAVATFPNHPSVACRAEVVTPMTLVNDATKTTAVTTTIPGLTTENATPLLAGMNVAKGLFGAEPRKAIVVLSDGYHNCPSPVTPASPAVTSLIDQLNAQSIRVFTIGFGRPTDVDHPLLEAFATQTTPPGYAGSQFYDVTVPGFDPLTWDPATALAGAYKAILVDALGLQAATDPLAVVTAGATLTRPVRISEHDRRVGVFVSWVTAQRGRLSLAVRAADGTLLGAGSRGVRVHQGDTYTILSVEPSFLRQAGKVGPAPWTIEIAPNAWRPGETEKIQYSVVVDSALRIRAAAGSGRERVGDTLTITAHLSEAGRPIAGLGEVSARVTRPRDGRGNWFTKNVVTAAQLERVPLVRGSERLSPTARRALAISDVLKVPYPGSADAGTLRLYDDGSHGDQKANDGVYTGLFTDTKSEGTYSFHITATGPTSAGNAFDRDLVVQRYLKIRPMPERSAVKLAAIGLDRAKVTASLVDALGNHAGPGYADAVRLAPSHGAMRGSVRDNGDGTYSQVLALPKGVRLKEVTVKLAARP